MNGKKTLRHTLVRGEELNQFHHSASYLGERVRVRWKKGKGASKRDKKAGKHLFYAHILSLMAWANMRHPRRGETEKPIKIRARFFSLFLSWPQSQYHKWGLTPSYNFVGAKKN